MAYKNSPVSSFFFWTFPSFPNIVLLPNQTIFSKKKKQIGILQTDKNIFF